MKKLLSAVFVLIGIAAFSQSYSSSSTGSWTTNSTWLGGTKPPLSGSSGQLSSNVTINTGNTVTLNGNLTVKSGVTLTVRGTLIITSGGNVDFQNGSTILVETGGTLSMNGLTNSNNSTNVTINGNLTVNGNYNAGSGASLSGNGSMEVSGTSSGSGTSFGVVLSCDNCTVSSGGIIEDVIVDGNVQNIDIPMDCNYRYNYSEFIFYQTEINREGNITNISFEYDGYEAFTEPIKLYMGHTSKTQFINSTNWVKSSGMSLVYDGNYSVSKANGWYTINFDTPFYYNNTDNLVIGFYEYGYPYHSSSADFFSYSTYPYNRVIYFDSDSENPNPASPPTADGTWYYVPSLKMTIEPVAQPLPIELLYFNGHFDKYQDKNILSWSTLSEKNNDYFTLEKSNNGSDWEIIAIEAGAGNSSTKLYYSLFDYNVDKVINYYRLKQTDYDGKFKYSDIISINNINIEDKKELIKIINILGQEIDLEYHTGLFIKCYSDGSSQKMIK